MSPDPKGAEVAEARRRFLANCGRFAVATPPAISLLLAASNANYAVAASGMGGNTGGVGGTNGVLGPTTNSSTTGGGNAAGSCHNTFDALFNNSKCL